MKKSLKISLMEDDLTVKSIVINSIHAREMVDLRSHKINTYKLMKEFLDCGLKDAKVMIDKLFEDMVHAANSPRTRSRNKLQTLRNLSVAKKISRNA